MFVTNEPYAKSGERREEMARRLLVHEYGHTIQSLLLGPLYLIIIGIPSASWANIPYFRNKRRKDKISYFSFFTEKWANSWGEKVTCEESMGQYLLD